MFREMAPIDNRVIIYWQIGFVDDCFRRGEVIKPIFEVNASYVIDWW